MKKAQQLAAELISALQHKRMASNMEDDITIKISAIALIIASFLALSNDRRHLARGKRAIFNLISDHIEKVWSQRHKKHHSIRDTQAMLQKIGILKNR